MNTLTKSLHTVTAAVNVANYILKVRATNGPTNGTTLAGMALSVLGYEYTRAQLDHTKDPTVHKVIEACTKIING